MLNSSTSLKKKKKKKNKTKKQRMVHDIGNRPKKN